MQTILDAVTQNIAAIVTFFVTAGIAALKRKFDLKKISKKQEIVDTFNNAK